MVKYKETAVTFAEVPDMITLCINITNCPCHCKGCHSPHLALNIGEELTFEELDNLIKCNNGIDTVGFMGGDADPKSINELAKYVHEKYNINTAWYSGREQLSEYINLDNFDFIKLGPYKEEFGPLDCKTTNQKMYKVNHENNELEDITYRFWEKI